MKDENIDCLLIHSDLEDGRKNSYHIMPLGFFSMADYLVKNGYKCKIINIGIEKCLNKNFSISEPIKRYNPKVIGIDLHWYVLAFSAIELARLCSQYCNAKIILGGYTASFFSREIMENFPFIDGIIHGYGEVPLLEYMRNLDKKDFKQVPNLTFRQNGEVNYSREICPPEPSLVDKLTFSNIYLMEHWDEYLANSAFISSGLSIYPQKKPEKMFYLPFGRGCSANCSYCSGSANAYLRFGGQENVYYRPVQMIINDIKALSGVGVDTYCVENYPPGNNDDFYITIFDKIRQENLDIGINFGCWHLPSDKFLDAFSGTFDLDKSWLSFSPESGSEYVRSINKGPSYSNTQLFKMINKMRSRGIYGSIHFSFGLPGETYSHFKETLEMFNKLKETGFYLSIRGIPLEPNSEMFVNPQKYKIEKSRNLFMDYYMTYKELFNLRTPRHPFGYRTENFTEEELSRIKIKAYRKFYLRPGFVLNRISKITKTGGLKENFKIFFAILIGSSNLLNRFER